MQFGIGPGLAAQCVQAPIPEGWRNWSDADGPIPDALLKRAQAFAGDPSVSLGSTESYPLPGVATLIRVEPRAWGRDAKGNLIEGCFRTGGIYLPGGATSVVVPPSSSSKLDKAVGVFTVASLAAGTVATIAGMKRRK